MQPVMTIPKIQSNYFTLNQLRVKELESLAEEYLSLLAVLYSDQIESGTNKVSDYGTMTMIDIENEIRLRTLLYRARRKRKQKDIRDKQEENERAMLETLRNIK